MKPATDFGRDEALALQAILESRSRSKDTMHYLEAAGFLFAVCCNPDMVRPSEWIPEVLGGSQGNFADPDEAQRTLGLLMRLYNDINRGALERRPALPWGCDLRADALANLEDDAPLARWARGFAIGYDWLQESWPEDLPGALDEGLGACLMVLTFFSRRSLAEAYWKESKRSDVSFDALAKTMQEMLVPTMAAFADLGRSIYEGGLKPRPPRRTRKPHAKRSRIKRPRGKGVRS